MLKVLAAPDPYKNVTLLEHKKSPVKFCVDAEEFARNHPARVVADFAAHLNTAYSIQEKQTAREQIRMATAGSLAGC